MISSVGPWQLLQLVLNQFYYYLIKFFKHHVASWNCMQQEFKMWLCYRCIVIIFDVHYQASYNGQMEKSMILHTPYLFKNNVPEYMIFFFYYFWVSSFVGKKKQRIIINYLTICWLAIHQKKRGTLLLLQKVKLGSDVPPSYSSEWYIS